MATDGSLLLSWSATPLSSRSSTLCIEFLPLEQWKTWWVSRALIIQQSFLFQWASMLTFFVKTLEAEVREIASNANVVTESISLPYSIENSYSYFAKTHIFHALYVLYWYASQDRQITFSRFLSLGAVDNAKRSLLLTFSTRHDLLHSPKYTNYNITKMSPSKNYIHFLHQVVLLRKA